MPLVARCHSLRPYKNSAWLSYFGLEPQGDRVAHFFTVGPAEAAPAAGREAALRAGQAVVRYLKEVPENAPAATVLANTRRLIRHEAESSQTDIAFGIAVVEKQSLYLVSHGNVMLVPLAGGSSVVSGDAETTLAVDGDSRFFLGHVPATLREETERADFGARLERGGSGDGGLVISFAGTGLSRVPSRAPSAKPQPPAPREEPKPVQTSIPLSTTPESVDDVAPSVAEILAADESEPSAATPAPEVSPAYEPTPEAARPAPERPKEPVIKRPSPVEAPPRPPEALPPEGGERRLSFWIGIVAALAAVALLVTYLVQLRPGPGTDPVAEAPEVQEPVVPDLANVSLGILWEQKFGDAVSSSPLVLSDRIVVGCRDGHVYAMDPADGARIWAYAAGDGFGSSPAAAGDVVVIGGYDGKIYALDAATGAERWSVATGGRIVASPAAAENLVLAGSYDRQLYALNAADGAVRWKKDLGAVIWASPAVSGDRVVVADLGGKVTALQLANGSVVWQSRVGGEIYASPDVGEGKVYVGAGTNLIALNLSDGAVAWTVPAGSKANGSPRYHEGRVIAGTDGGAIFAVDAALGQKVWEAATGGAVKARPVFYERTVWVPSYDGYLHGIEWMTGAPGAKINLDTTVFSSPSVRDGNAYFGGMDGRFFAVRLGLATP